MTRARPSSTPGPLVRAEAPAGPGSGDQGSSGALPANDVIVAVHSGTGDLGEVPLGR